MACQNLYQMLYPPGTGGRESWVNMAYDADFGSGISKIQHSVSNSPTYMYIWSLRYKYFGNIETREEFNDFVLQ